MLASAEKIIYRNLGGYSTISEDDILVEIYRSELMQQLCSAIEQLPDKYGYGIKMAFIDGLKNHEIAEKLGIPVSAVNTQKARGLVALRKILPKHSLPLPLLVMM